MLVLAFAISLFAQAGNPIVTPPQTSPINVTNTTVVQVPPMDDEAVAEASAVANQSFVVNTVQPVPTQWVNALCSLPNIWTTTPPAATYAHADLVQLATLIQNIALATSGLALLAVGIALLAGADAFDRFARLFLAFATVFGHRLWWEWGINLNNAINAVISPPDMCGTLIRPHIEMVRPEPGADVAAPALVIVYAVVSIMLLVSLAFRIGLIDVLFAAGALFELCWADEHSEALAQWYQRISVGTVYGQVLLVIGLRAANALSSLGNSVLTGALLSIVVLLICRKLLSVLSAQERHERSGTRTGGVIALAVRRLVLRFV